ncbi:MAG: DUF2796 domain-containing protein [Acidiferrobacterales bacterium]|nr:DUF2796 domain-containing protein [Acidiferrobacterales bacterium]
MNLLSVIFRSERTVSWFYPILIIGFAAAQQAFGADSHSHSHKAHTHGEANLTIAADEKNLELQLEAPAMSLVGFEHKPTSPKQIESVINTRALLEKASNILVLKGGSCVAMSMSSNITGPASHYAIEQYNKATESHDEELKHEKDHAHADAKDHHAEPAKKKGHSEFIVLHSYECDDAFAIKSISVGLFEEFSNLEKIKVNWIVGTKQGQKTLLPANTVIDLK